MINPKLEVMREFVFSVIVACIMGVTVRAQEVNYDESKVGSYTLEDPLRFVNGKKVKNLRDWSLRRQEILDIFQREMYGQMPPKSDIYLEELERGTTLAGFGLRRQVRMRFRSDKTGPFIDWLIVSPRHARSAVPAIILLNYKGNHTVLSDEEIIEAEIPLPANQRHAGAERGLLNNPNGNTYYPVSMLLSRGYALVTACYSDISSDPTDAVGQEKYAYQRCFDLWPPRDSTRDDNTTALGAWAWGLMRGMDMIEKDSLLDEKKVIVAGCSRLGKAALIAGAYDERFSVVVPIQTAGGGVKLSKHFFGENIATEMRSFTHWYCKAYKKYAGKENTMTFDQHLLVACIAPRGLLVEGFNDQWYDTKGEFLSLKAASPVWEKFCKTGLPKVEWPDDFDTSAIGERLGYVRRKEKHGISAYDWTWMMDFADNMWKTTVKHNQR